MLRRTVALRSAISNFYFTAYQTPRSPRVFQGTRLRSKNNFPCTTFQHSLTTNMASADSSMTPEEKYQLISRNLQVGFKLKVIPGLIFSKQDRHMVINIP